MANFSSILDMPSSEIKFPKLPAGSYVGIVKGMPRHGKSTKKMTEFVEFQIQIVEPLKGEDGESTVDTDELEAFGPLGEAALPLTFYYSDSDGKALEGGVRRMRDFLSSCGLEEGDNYNNYREAFEQVPGRTLIVDIKHQPSQDGRSIYAQIDGTARYGE